MFCILGVCPQETLLSTVLQIIECLGTTFLQVLTGDGFLNLYARFRNTKILGLNFFRRATQQKNTGFGGEIKKEIAKNKKYSVVLFKKTTAIYF